VGKILKFILLAGPEKLIFCQAVYLLVYYWVALHRQRFHQLIARLLNTDSGDHQQGTKLIPADVIIRLFVAACRIVPFSTCLSRAMAGQQLLTRYGYSPIFHIGVAREGQQALEAHAWLSLDENLILGNIPDLDRFRELPPLQAEWPEKS